MANNQTNEERGGVVLRSGTITRIKQQSKRANRISLFVDGEFALGLAASVFVTSGIRKGDLVTVEQLSVLQREDSVLSARGKAMHYLSYRARTVREIKDRMTKYGFDEDIVSELVRWLGDQGYIDDADFAEQFGDERFRRKGYGPRRIAQDLARKGVDRSIIDAVVGDMRASEDAISPVILRKAALRWRGLRRETDPRKRKSKLVQYLQRRGFDYAVALKIFEQVEMSSEAAGNEGESQ